MKKIFIVILCMVGGLLFGGRASAASCVDIEFVFARGSGGVHVENVEYQAFVRTMTKMANRIGMASYRFTDVDYPAVSVSVPANAIGAYISAGKYYAFGRSVTSGVDWLTNYYDKTMRNCSATRWVLAGYSQGAMVIAQAVQHFRADRVIYIGLVADPQTNLPEGRGLIPDACLGRNYSPYRVFVPVCRTNKGRLGARNPYQYGDLAGKYGLWCGRNDYVCGSTASPLNNSGHTQYVDAGSYMQMSYLVQQKLTTSTSPVMRSARTVASDAELYAFLNQDEFFARPEDEVVISAEMSFSINSQITTYEWAIDDSDYAVGDAVLRMSFPLGKHQIRLKIRDAKGLTAEAVAQVTVADSFMDEDLPAPLVRAERQADAVYFTWHDVPERAQYLLVRLNGFDLDYVKADSLVVGIHDLEINDQDTLSVAWMDADFNVGVEHMVVIKDVEEVEVLSHEQTLQPKDTDAESANAPQTGVNMSDVFLLGVIVILACIFVIVIKNTRHLRDG